MTKVRLRKTFLMTLTFFILFSLIFMTKPYKNLASIQKRNSWKNQTAALTRQVKELEGLKQNYLTKAIKHETQGQKIQVREGEVLIAKRYFNLANQSRLLAEEIQKDIDELYMEKEKLREGRSESRETVKEASVKNP